MNETLETIFNRKSVRAYRDEKIDQETLELLVKAGMAAPSGVDTRPWEFIIIDDKGILERIAANLKYGKMLKNAAGAIAVCGQPKKSIFEGDEFWLMDCSNAAENILVAAESLGLGAVWVSCYPSQERINKVKPILDLPSGVEPLCIISLGYPLIDQKAKNKFNAKQVHWNRW